MTTSEERERWTIYVCPECQAREIAPPYGGPCPGCGSAMKSIEVCRASQLQQLQRERDEWRAGALREYKLVDELKPRAEQAEQTIAERDRYKAALEELIPWARRAFDGLEVERESERADLWEELAGPPDQLSVPQKAEATLSISSSGGE